MTIAISLKVNDGLVLAADSASTLMSQNPDGTLVVSNIYNNANKIFNLRKVFPVGAITWGAGSIGKASISTLMKDLRKRFSSEGDDLWIDPERYSIKDIASKVRKFIFEENYLGAFKEWGIKPDLGFIVAGYSSGETMAEEYLIKISNGVCADPSLINERDLCGIFWDGQPEAISRLLMGFDPSLPVVLQTELGVPEEQVGWAVETIRKNLEIVVLDPTIPVQDAIDLAEFLVDLTIKFSRFRPGAPTVGGPIEVAAITKHEGFKWVKRKHYYSHELNQEG